MADKFVHSNFAVTTLREAVAPGDTTFQINVGDVGRFPALAAGTKFTLILADSNDNLEIVWVSHLDSAGLATVERGREGTTALSWLSGTFARHGYTAASIVGAAGFRPRGEWNDFTSYEANDVVEEGGISYLAVNANLNDEPPSANWQILYQPPTTGAATLTWRGRYASGTTYTVGSLVEFSSRVWQSLVSGNLGNTPALNSTFWEPVARWSGAGEYSPVLAATGTNNLVLSPNAAEAPTDWFEGLTFRFRAVAANTGNATIATALLAAKPIRWASGQELPPGYLQGSEVYEGSYAAGTDEFILLNTAGLRLRGVPTGVILTYGGVTAPAGYLLCDGSTVSQTTYAALFAAISTRYNTGGEAAGTFRLPDYRGRADVGADNIGGTAAGRLTGYITGSAGGSQTHTLDLTQIPSHNHGVTDPQHNHGTTQSPHSHGVNDPTHSHGVADPTHGHGVSDPTHTHGTNGVANAGSASATTPGAINAALFGGGETISAAATGISIVPAATGIGIAGALTGISISGNTISLSVNNALTGITVNNAGGGLAHPNVQPSLAGTKIIKT
jgi:microcystin-dependent protein